MPVRFNAPAYRAALRRHDPVLTTAEVARKLNLHRTTVQRWVDGTNAPTINHLSALASLLKMPLSDLISDLILED